MPIVLECLTLYHTVQIWLECPQSRSVAGSCAISSLSFLVHKKKGRGCHQLDDVEDICV